MHSSRIRTSRSLPYGGVGGEVSVQDGFLSRRSLSRGSLSRESLSRGSLSGRPLPLPSVNRMTSAKHNNRRLYQKSQCTHKLFQWGNFVMLRTQTLDTSRKGNLPPPGLIVWTSPCAPEDYRLVNSLGVCTSITHIYPLL